MPARDQRFIYSASAVGVGANYTGADALNQSFAACSLPFVGGEATATAPGRKGAVLSFTGATTRIKGSESAGKFVTVTETTVTGLDILGKIKAAEVGVRLAFTFESGSKKVAEVDVSAVYAGLTIDGADFSNVQLDAALADKAGKDHANLAQHLGDHKKVHHKTKNGKTFTSLAKEDARLNYTPTEHAFIDVAGVGRVYFAEWAEAEDWQAVTGLRVVLSGNSTGEIVIADPIGNGQFYP